MMLSVPMEKGRVYQRDRSNGVSQKFLAECQLSNGDWAGIGSFPGVRDYTMIITKEYSHLWEEVPETRSVILYSGRDSKNIYARVTHPEEATAKVRELESPTSGWKVLKTIEVEL